MKKNLIIIFLVCSLKSYSQKETDYLCVCHFWGSVEQYGGVKMVLLEPFLVDSKLANNYSDYWHSSTNIVNAFKNEIGFDKIEVGFDSRLKLGVAFQAKGCKIFKFTNKSEADEAFKSRLKYAKYLVKWQPPFDLTGIPVTQKSPVITKVEKEEVKAATSKEKVNKDYITKSTYHEDAKKAVELARLRLLKAEADDMVKKMAARAEGMLLDLKLEQMLAKLRNQPKMKTNKQ